MLNWDCSNVKSIGPKQHKDCKVQCIVQYIGHCVKTKMASTEHIDKLHIHSGSGVTWISILDDAAVSFYTSKGQLEKLSLQTWSKHYFRSFFTHKKYLMLVIEIQRFKFKHDKMSAASVRKKFDWLNFDVYKVTVTTFSQCAEPFFNKWSPIDWQIKRHIERQIQQISTLTHT